MKLVYNKKANDPSYYIQHSFRIGEKVSTKTVLTIGKHSDLLKITNDPLEYAKEITKKYVDDYNNSKNTNLDNKRMSADNSTSKRVVNSTALNIGYIYLHSIYSKLKINNFLQEVTKNNKFQFNADEINRFLTFDRILNPRSKYSFSKSINNYYEKPKIEYHNILRFMDVLAKNSDKYLNHLLDKSENIFKRDTSVCYYDCTNYYFEIESPDDDYIDPITGETILGLRKYGFCKEHRPNPIVQMGLFMDKHGIPLTMDIFRGNQNEQASTKPLELKLIRGLKNQKIIYCADAGLGSIESRLLNDMGGRAFIVTQSIKKLSDDLKATVFDDKDYKLLSNDTDTTIEEMKTFDIKNQDNINLYNDRAYKVIDVDSAVDLGLFEEKTLKNGKTVQVKSKASLKQKIIITYSRKHAEYQKRIRDKQIERAKKLVDTNGVDKKKKGPNDVTRFITNKANNKTEYIIDQDRIDEEAKYDGFYAIATNLECETPKEIFEINQERYKIEECFRILKTNFDARPIYHHLNDRIVAHFLICYTALLIYRLLENKLKEKEHKYTTNEIITSLRNINVSPYENKYISNYEYATILDDLFDSLGVDLKFTEYGYSEIDKIIKKI